MQNLKLLVVGDGGVGKSCLLIAYTTNSFPSSYVPTVFDNYAGNVMIDGQPLCVGFWDTAGQEDYDRLRPLSYPQTDIALICFDIANRDSFENIESKWLPELNHHIPEVPKLVVACKCDLERSEPPERQVTDHEISVMCKRQRLRCVKTSALELRDLKECFDTAFRMGFDFMKAGSRKSRSFSLFKSKKKADDRPVPPVMPPAGKAPWLEVETSTFADDWLKTLQSPSHSDVVFIVEQTERLKAHKIMLCSASKTFSRIIGIRDSVEENQLKKFENQASFTRDELNCGKVLGIKSVSNERKPDKTGDQIVIELSDDISGKSFVKLLQFLYAGVPQFPEDVSDSEVDEVLRLAEIFQLRELQTICENLKTEQDFLNPSIGTFLNDETGKRMKELFFNKSLLADIVFNVEDQKIFGHKAVVAARCDVMAAMFGGNFAEGTTDITEIDLHDTTAENFLALLEYLYTDHAPIESSDAVGILVLADQYFQTRLKNLCELYITKEVDRQCQKRIERSEIDVIGLLLKAQFHNAEQLSNWCLHFISTNFESFQKRPEFPQLSGDNLDYVEEHRWPPVSYINELKEYETLMQKKGYKDACVLQ